MDAFAATTSAFQVRPDVRLWFERSGRLIPEGWRFHQSSAKETPHAGRQITHILKHEATETCLKITNPDGLDKSMRVETNLPRIGFGSQGHVISNPREFRHATRCLSDLIGEIAEPRAGSIFSSGGDVEDRFGLTLSSVEIGYQFMRDFAREALPLLATCAIPRLHKHPIGNHQGWRHEGSEISAKAYDKRYVMKACQRDVLPGPPVTRIEFKVSRAKLKEEFKKLHIPRELGLIRFSDLVRFFKHQLRTMSPRPVVIARGENSILAEVVALLNASHGLLGGQDPLDFCLGRMDRRKWNLFRARVMAVRLEELTSLFDILIPPGTAEDVMPPPAHVKEAGVSGLQVRHADPPPGA